MKDINITKRYKNPLQDWLDTQYPAIFLAPMAGITDLAFRQICSMYGLDFTYTEMINAKGIYYQDPKTMAMLKSNAQEKPVIAQIFGHEPRYLAYAAQFIESIGVFCGIDINMGCPVPKVIRNGEGSALLLKPELAKSIVDAVRNVIQLPLSIKTRLGWQSKGEEIFNFCKMMQDLGVDFIGLHGRTRAQLYSGKADWLMVSKVNQLLHIPVVVSGDIFSFQAVKKLSTLGLHHIMVARGAQGNPFIFEEIKKRRTHNPYQSPTDIERLDTYLKHFHLALQYKEQRQAIVQMRKHFHWYAKGMDHTHQLKDALNNLLDADEVFELIDTFKHEKLAIQKTDHLTK